MSLEDQGRHLVYILPRQQRALCPRLSTNCHSRGMPLTPAFHDQLGDLHDNEEASTLPTSQQQLPDFTGPGCFGPPRPLEWERLIRSPLTTHERISLITDIFSNQDGVEVVRRLYGNDAQTFVDVTYEARLYAFIPKGHIL